MPVTWKKAAIAATVFAGVLCASAEADAQLVLSQLIVDLGSADQAQDIEVSNSGEELAYVSAEPREILNAGTAEEHDFKVPDPEALGLLVSPGRMILEPGQRKLIRIAALASRGDMERVYRVTVRPVVGQLSPKHSGLKILVGYDVLVLVRPTTLRPQLVGIRSGDRLVIRNVGNTSVELTDGQECDSQGKNCQHLTGGRIYAGAQKEIAAMPGHPVQYKAEVADKVITQVF